MTHAELKKAIGKKVLVTHRGLILTGKYVGEPDKFKWRDGLVQLPHEAKPRQFNADKISPYTP